MRKLLHFVRPYWRHSLVALCFPVAVTLMDLAIQRMIDKGINGNNVQVVISTTIIMQVISLFQTLFALAKNPYPTIRDADHVIMINSGEIVEQGTHQQLLDAREFFHRLYMSQFKGLASGV